MVGRRRRETTSTSAVSAPRSATNVKFTGQATIVPGWTAGYVLHIEADGSDMLLDDQPGPALTALALYTGAPTATTCRRCSPTGSSRASSLGKVSVGLQSQASDNTAILVDGSGSLVPANWVQFDYGGFAASCMLAAL